MKTQEEVVRQHAVGPISIYEIYQEGYQDRELDDWEAFRRDAAKDAMCVLIGMGRDDGYKYSPHEVARYAIVYADELIKQLKDEEQ